MPDTPPTPLTPEDAAVVDGEVARLAAQPGRRDPQAAGCLVAFVGMLALTLTPAVGNFVEIPLPTGTTVFGISILAIFAGAAIAIFGGGLKGTRGAAREVRSAVGPILAHTQVDASREDALRAATRLLANAYDSSGPYVVRVFDPAVMAERLGPGGIRLVQAVERHRRESDDRFLPVFTLDSRTPVDPGAQAS